MDRLYSKNALIIKAATCVMLSPLCILVSSLIDIQNPFVYIMVTLVPIGCLYTIPFWMSVSYLSKYRIKSIKKYILLDILSCFVSATLGVLCTEIVYTVIYADTSVAGMLTLIFAVIFLIISAIFWLMYLILSHKK